MKLQADLNRVEHWLSTNKLTLNVKKTKSMIFHSAYFTGNTVVDLNLGGESIEQVQLFKYLGIWLDPKLSFNYHIEIVCKKSKMRLGAIGRVRKFITNWISHSTCTKAL